MDLVRSWLGQALRATGAAVVVPVAILAALSLSTLGGSGLGGLGALSQIVSGPDVAGSGGTMDDGDAEIADAVTQLAASDPAPAGSDAVPPAGAPPGNGPGEPTAPGDPSPPPGTGGPGPGDPPAPAPPGGGGPDPEPPATAPPAAPPPEPPGAVEGVGEGLNDVTAGTPVAPTVEDAVDALGEACGRLGCP